MKHYIWKIRNFFLALITHKTIGVRGIVIKDNEILLVKHTYLDGWYHAGGGVENKETPIQAIKRELMEEVGITCLDPVLFNVYHSRREGRDDYIIFFILKNITQQYAYSNEILETKWFPITDLPLDISPATKRRIEEYLGKREISDVW